MAWAQKTLLQEALERPISSMIGILCSGIWFYLWNNRVEYTKVGLNYTKVVCEQEYWRILSSAFSHISFLHLAFNLGSLWSISPLELYLGRVHYIKTTFLLLVGSQMLYLLIHHILIKRFGRNQAVHTFGIGYSGILFGWQTIFALWSPKAKLTLPGGIEIPFSLSPFFSLIMIQIFIRNASFVGHLSGIVIGFLVAWKAFFWVNDAVFLFLFVAFSVVIIKSLNTSLISFIMPRVNQTQRVVMRSGVVVRNNSNSDPGV